MNPQKRQAIFARLRETQCRDDRLAAKALTRLDELDARDDLAAEDIAKKKAVVAAARERARARRRQTTTRPHE